MDTHPLRQFEEEARREARVAFATEDPVPPSPWGTAAGTVYEDLAYTADMLARVASVYPRDPNYVRSKSAELLSTVARLYDHVMTTPVCGFETPLSVDEHGYYEVDQCLRPAAHDGDHTSNRVSDRLAEHAHRTLDDAITLVARVRWAQLAGEWIDDDDRADVREAIASVRGRLDQLAALVDQAHQPAD